MRQNRLIAVVGAMLALVVAGVLAFAVLSGPETRDGRGPFVPEVVPVASAVPERPPRPATDPDDDDNDEPDERDEQDGPDADDRDAD